MTLRLSQLNTPFDIPSNLEVIRQQITRACVKSNRNPSSVTLIAVSKTKSSSLIRAAYDSGQSDFGENYVQEMLQKQKELSDLKISWHFIGHLQRRKVKEIVGQVKLIHSLDSEKLAQEIAKEATKKKLIQNCLLQIKLGDEETKSGTLPSEAAAFLKNCSSLTSIKITGLMTLPPPMPQPEQARPFFHKLRLLQEQLNQQTIYPFPLTELSMGMSHDFPIAIEEGATLIRIGTALFGERF